MKRSIFRLGIVTMLFATGCQNTNIGNSAPAGVALKEAKLIGDEWSLTT